MDIESHLAMPMGVRNERKLTMDIQSDLAMPMYHEHGHSKILDIKYSELSDDLITGIHAFTFRFCGNHLKRNSFIMFKNHFSTYPLSTKRKILPSHQTKDGLTLSQH